MSICENKNKCKRCDRTFRFNETIRPLQRSKELCEFVFASGLIDVNKLIDVSQLNVPLCNTCYQYYNRKMKASCTSTKEESMEAAFGDVPKTFMNASSQTEDFNIIFLTRSDSDDMIVDSSIAATMINPETTHTTDSISLLPVAPYVCLTFYRLSTSHPRCSVCDADFSGNSSFLVLSDDIRARVFLEHDITGVPKRMATCFVEVFSLLIDFSDLLISLFYSFFISLQNGGFTLRKIFQNKIF